MARITNKTTGDKAINELIIKTKKPLTIMYVEPPRPWPHETRRFKPGRYKKHLPAKSVTYKQIKDGKRLGTVHGKSLIREDGSLIGHIDGDKIINVSGVIVGEIKSIRNILNPTIVITSNRDKALLGIELDDSFSINIE